MKKCVYPGTFDPITFGHIDVIKRSLDVFDKTIVAITNNPIKQGFFSLEDRVFFAKESLKEFSGRVEVYSFEGLLVDFLKSVDCKIILRGLRALSDFEFEFQQALANKSLSPDIDTFFVMTDAKYFYLSSSLVRELSILGADVSSFVPPCVKKALKKRSAVH